MEVDSLEETDRGERGFGSTGGHEILNTAIISAVKKLSFATTFLEQVRQASKKESDYQTFLTTTPEDKNRVIEDQLIYYKGRLQLPNDNQLRLDVLTEEHDSRVAGHFGQKKTLELVSRNFYWPEMEGWIKKYVGSCDECQRNKSPRHARFGLYNRWNYLTLHGYQPWSIL